MYYRPPPQRGPYISKRLPHEKRSAGDNRPPRDLFDRTFPSPSPRAYTDDAYDASDGMSLGVTPNGDAQPVLLTSAVLQNTSFSSREAGSLSPFSRTTSQNGSLDMQQEKTVHKAYHVSFNGDKRVKETNVVVAMNDLTFLLVERMTAGQSDGAYQKNKKLWEHVPRGQVKVFVSVPLTDGPDATHSAPSTPSFAFSASDDDQSTRHRYTCLGTLCGLRKFGHWGDKSASVYAVPKESASHAIAVERVDGVSGQVAAVQYQSERYWAVGCTARHILTRFDVPEEDVSAYAAGTPGAITESLAETNEPSASRTLWEAQAIARAWRRILLSLQGSNTLTTDPMAAAATAEELHQSMVTHKWTLCFDALLDGREALIDYTTDGMAPMATTLPIATEGTASADSREEAAQGGETVSLSASSVNSCRGGADVLETEEEEDVAVLIPPQSLIFYAITTDSPSTKGLCLPVTDAYDVFHTYGLTTAARSPEVALGTDAYSAVCSSIAAKTYSAGAVFYGTNSAGTVVQLWKCRCTHHTMERVAQESIVNNGVYGASLLAKLKRSIANLPKATRADAVAWEAERGPFVAAFSAWLYETKRMSPSMDATAKRTIRDHWLSLQRSFYDELSTDTDSADEDDRGDDADTRDAGEAETISDSGGTHRETREPASASLSPDGLVSCERSVDSSEKGAFPARECRSGSTEAILMVGPQGCGKSTIARALFALLEQCGQAPRWLNQDEVGSRHAYIASIRRTVEEGICTHLLLDKMNLTAASRNADYGALSHRVVLTVAWTHRDGAERLADVCFERVCQRGSSHRSLKIPPTPSPPRSDDAGSYCPRAAVGSRKNEHALQRLRGILNQSIAKMETSAMASNVVGGGGPSMVPGTPKSVPKNQASIPASPVGANDVAESAGYSTASSSPRQAGSSPAAASPTMAATQVVELDVRWSVEMCLEHIWPRLCAASARPLPPLETLDAPAAVAMSRAYEALLSRHPHRTTSAVLEVTPPNTWTRYLPDTGFDWTDKSKPPVRPPAFFVVHDFLTDPSPSLLVEYDALDGHSVSIELEAVVSDCRATVLCARRAPFLRRRSNLDVLRQRSSADLLDRSDASVSAHMRQHSSQGVPSAQSPLGGPLLFAVVAQAKKVTLTYCRELVHRVLLQGEEDPYCCVFRFPPRATITATCALKSI